MCLYSLWVSNNKTEYVFDAVLNSFMKDAVMTKKEKKTKETQGVLNFRVVGQGTASALSMLAHFPEKLRRYYRGVFQRMGLL